MMTDAAVAVGTAQLQNAYASTKAQLATTKSRIDWNDFNYPPMFRFFHFSLSELREPHLPIVKRLWLINMLQTLHFFFNLFNCIVQSAMGLGIVRSISSPLWFIFLSAVSTYGFYSGYRGICENSTLLMRYKICCGVMLLLHLIMLIPDALCFNGIIRLSNLFSGNYAFPGVLCIIESLYILGLEGFTVMIFLQVLKWSHPPVNY